MFKERFKYYKCKKSAPILDNVYDLHDANYNIDESEIKRIYLQNDGNYFTLTSPKTWEVYKFLDKPGLVYIKNPFTALGQRYWSVQCLKDYSKKVNKRNIDVLNVVPENEEWWNMAQNDKNVLSKMRWATLGYHHNWDTKVYSEENKGDFPEDLVSLTKTIAYNLDFQNFSPEAAIINYYHMDSTLSGHTDHSEQNLKAPLFSFSFGQTAIFLLGGTTIEEDPVAIFLKSGDIVVMSEESRLCYHGVPKILKATEKTWNQIVFEGEFCNQNETLKICLDENEWKPYGEYLNHCRINMNVRQVLNENQNSLTSL